MMEKDIDLKRKSRNLSEKKRRDQFNNLINELNLLIDPLFTAGGGGGGGGASQSEPQDDEESVGSCSNVAVAARNQRKMDKSSVLKCAMEFLKKHSNQGSQHHAPSDSMNNSIHGDEDQEALHNPNEMSQNPTEQNIYNTSSWKPSYITDDEFSVQMLEALDAFIVVCEVNEEARIIYSSDTLTNLLNYTGTCNSLGQNDYVSLFDLLASNDRQQIERLFSQTPSMEQNPFDECMSQASRKQLADMRQCLDRSLGLSGPGGGAPNAADDEYVSLIVNFRTGLNLSDIKQKRQQVITARETASNVVSASELESMNGTEGLHQEQKYYSNQTGESNSPALVQPQSAPLVLPENQSCLAQQQHLDDGSTQAQQQQQQLQQSCKQISNQQPMRQHPSEQEIVYMQVIDESTNRSTVSLRSQQSIAEQQQLLMSEGRREQQEHNQHEQQRRQQQSRKKADGPCSKTVEEEEDEEEDQESKQQMGAADDNPLSDSSNAAENGSSDDNAGQQNSSSGGTNSDENDQPSATGSDDASDSNQSRSVTSRDSRQHQYKHYHHHHHHHNHQNQHNHQHSPQANQKVDLGGKQEQSQEPQQPQLHQKQDQHQGQQQSHQQQQQQHNQQQHHQSEQAQGRPHHNQRQHHHNQHHHHHHRRSRSKVLNSNRQQFELVRLMGTFKGFVDESMASAKGEDDEDDDQSFDGCDTSGQLAPAPPPPPSITSQKKRYFICIGKLDTPRFSYDLKIIVPPVTGGINVFHSNQFLSKHTLKWRFLWIDNRAPAIIGYLPFEVLGTSGYDYYHWDDLDKLVISHETLMRDGYASSGPYRFLTKGQQWIWLQTKYCIVLKQQPGGDNQQGRKGAKKQRQLEGPNDQQAKENLFEQEQHFQSYQPQIDGPISQLVPDNQRDSTAGSIIQYEMQSGEFNYNQSYVDNYMTNVNQYQHEQHQQYQDGPLEFKGAAHYGNQQDQNLQGNDTSGITYTISTHGMRMNEPKKFRSDQVERQEQKQQQQQQVSIKPNDNFLSRSLDQFKFILCTHTVIGFDESDDLTGGGGGSGEGGNEKV